MSVKLIDLKVNPSSEGETRSVELRLQLSDGQNWGCMIGVKDSGGAHEIAKAMRLIIGYLENDPRIK